STSSAAYSVPRCVVLIHVESASILVNGWSAKGCTYQSPLRAYKTIFCSLLAPLTRPLISSSSRPPPFSAGGTVVISIDGCTLDETAQPQIKTANRHTAPIAGPVRRGIMMRRLSPILRILQNLAVFFKSQLPQ